MDTKEIMLEQRMSDSGGEVHLSPGLRFTFIPLLLCGMICTVITMTHCCQSNNVLTDAAKQLKECRKGSGEENKIVISEMAGLFMDKLNANKRVIIVRNTVEVILMCVLLGFEILITVTHGVPFISEIFQSTMDCILYKKSALEHPGPDDQQWDRISTKCSLARSTSYQVGYSCLWLLVLADIIFSMSVNMFRAVLFYSLAARKRYNRRLLGADIVGHAEMFEELISCLSTSDYDMLMHCRNLLGGAPRHYLFTSLATQINNKIQGRETDDEEENVGGDNDNVGDDNDNVGGDNDETGGDN